MKQLIDETDIIFIFSVITFKSVDQKEKLKCILKKLCVRMQTEFVLVQCVPLVREFL